MTPARKVKSLLASLLCTAASGSDPIYHLSRRIVDAHDGQNNGDPRTNGEYYLSSKILPACKIVFDVGANVGDWTSQALSINRQAEYHCFEPSHATFQILALRGLPPNVRLNRVALGHEHSEIELNVFEAGSQLSSLYERPVIGIPVEKERVSVTTVDAYLSERGLDEVDFVKLDVEGHEFAAIRGARRSLENGRIGVLQFEYGGTYIDARVFLRDIWEFVGDMNSAYVFGRLRARSVEKVARYSPDLDSFQYSNWAIVHRRWLSVVF